MTSFWTLLRQNPNYRYTWMGQVVSEIGDHFNTIAVVSLALHIPGGSSVVVGGVMLARTLPAIIAGPLAGVALDRFDRRKIMLASDLLRCLIALGFVLVLTHQQTWLLYALSALLTFASPFFTSGRSSILPRITTSEELHTANALTQTTAWLTLSIGAMLGGVSTRQFGYEWAFVANSASFLFSAWAIWNLRSREGHFRPARDVIPKHQSAGEWARDFADSLRYMWRTPLIFAIGMAYVGWASGGGAAQILFTLFGEIVYKAGPAGIGTLWGAAGLGLVVGGITAHRLGRVLGFNGYKHAISVGYFIHGAAYVLFAIAPTIWLSALAVAVSRIAMGSNNVLNRTMLLTHVPDQFRGRVFSTVEMMLNTVMMISMALSSIATGPLGIRTVGVIAGVLSGSTAVFWALANATGRLPEPRPEPADEQHYESAVTPA